VFYTSALHNLRVLGSSLNRSLTLFIHSVPNLLLPTNPTQSLHHQVFLPCPPLRGLPPLAPLGPAGRPVLVRVGRGAPSPLYNLQIQKKRTRNICDRRIEADGRPRMWSIISSWEVGSSGCGDYRSFPVDSGLITMRLRSSIVQSRKYHGLIAWFCRKLYVCSACNCLCSSER
jgi:hypothetical protein